MNKKTKIEEIIKADDKPIKIVDWQKQLQEFMKIDDKKHFLFFKLIGESDFKEAEMIEHLLLKMFDSIREEMITSDFYTKNDLADVNFFLQVVKLHIENERLGDMDLQPKRCF